MLLLKQRSCPARTQTPYLKLKLRIGRLEFIQLLIQRKPYLDWKEAVEVTAHRTGVLGYEYGESSDLTISGSSWDASF